MNSLNNRCLSGYECSNNFALYHIHAVLRGERIKERDSRLPVFLISAPGVQIFMGLTVSFSLF